MSKKLLILLAALMIVGCSTPYKASSVWDPNGYSEVFLDKSRVVITFTSTRQDRSEAVIRGAMLRAAELAKERGFDTFLVVSDSGNESTSAFSTGGSYSGTTIGSQTFGTFTPGIPIIINRAQQRLTVQFFYRIDQVAGAFNAEDVIRENSQRFK